VPFVDDWPPSSIRTKAFAVIGVGAVLLQGTITAFNLLGPSSRMAADSLGVLVVISAVLVSLWCASKNRERRALLLSALLSVGITLRAVGLLKFSYFTPSIPAEVPGMGARVVLAASYLALGGGLAASAIELSRRVRAQSAAVLSVGAGVLVASFLGFAAFGPVPGPFAVYTARDQFAAALLSADVVLFALSAFVTLSLLHIGGGTMSRAWLWITVGLLLAAMGDTALPMLEPADAPHYVSLMWGCGYALAAVGALLALDINEWHRRRGEPLPMMAAFSGGRARRRRA
jgi:hypothetical protein